MAHQLCVIKEHVHEYVLEMATNGIPSLYCVPDMILPHVGISANALITVFRYRNNKICDYKIHFFYSFTTNKFLYFLVGGNIQLLEGCFAVDLYFGHGGDGGGGVRRRSVSRYIKIVTIFKIEITCMDFGSKYLSYVN